MNRVWLFTTLTLLTPTALHAGGPLNTYGGKAVVYRTSSPITYHLDKGPMGQFSNLTARTLAIESFKVWEDVPNATIAFKTDSLSVDVNAGNYTTYLGTNVDGLSPIIFDSDGGIIDALFGAGSSTHVIGFAGSFYPTAGANAGYYLEGYSVMNGAMANNPFTAAQFKATFVHEFGHFIGLDHTQINAAFAADGNTANDIYIPTMYPTSTDDDTQLATLKPDDIAAVSTLYPIATFAATTGRITGTLIRTDSTGVRGANVVACLLSDSLYTQISTVTDYYQQLTGSFTLSGLPPGQYAVRIERISSSFTGGSSVGPYADDLSGLSFVNPVGTEWFNGANESGDPAKDTATSWVVVPVNAGGTTVIGMIANGEATPPASGTLQNYGAPAFVFSLPSAFMDIGYAVRFTPGGKAKLQSVEFLLNGGSKAILGNGTLQVSVHQNVPGSIDGIPGAQLGSAVIRSFASLTAGAFNLVDLSSLNLVFEPFTSFHVAFTLADTTGNRLQFTSDDGVTAPTNRSSSWFDDGSGLVWQNLGEPTNWLKPYNLIVRATISAVTGVTTGTIMPDGFTLGQNYPNPFNPTTVIPFRIASRERVRLFIVDLLGRTVATIIDGEDVEPGDHAVVFDAGHLSSGVYFAVMTVASTQQYLKLLLVR